MRRSLGVRLTRLWLAVSLSMLLIPCLARAQDSTGVRVTDRGIVIDFQDVDLRVLIGALAEAGGLNVVYGELPTRRVTLRMSQGVPREQVAALLRSIAQSNGLRIEEEGGFLRVSAAEAAATNSARRADSGAQASGEPRLFVHRLRHARAAKIAATLQAVFGGRPDEEADASERRPSLSEQLRNTQVRPTNLDSARAAPAPEVSGMSARLSGAVQIVAEEATNALLVRALPEDWATIQQAVQALDLRPLQVLIEVLIAEVRDTRGLDVGVSTVVQRDGRGGNKQSAELKSASIADFVAKLSNGGKVDVDVAISALATRGMVRVLSRPLLLAQNNQEARILVGSERPFVQVFRSLPTEAAVRDQVVQYRDVGTSLTITPTINPDDYVNLQVVQEVSTATSESQFGAPIISTREASTHLFVRNGQTAVLGGLIDRQTDRSRSGIPILSSIPILGALFGSTKISNTTNELFLFLTPYLVRTDDELDAIRQRVGEESSLDKSAVPSVLRDSTTVRPRRPPDR